MKSIFLNYFIPVLMLGVIAHQYYAVEVHDLTRWKGGGFGMYSEIPWKFREVWFFGLAPHIDPFLGFEDEVDELRRLPSEKKMLELGKKVKEKHNASELRVEVWEPRFEDGVLSRVLLKSVNVP